MPKSKKTVTKMKSVNVGDAKVTKTTVNKPGMGGKSRSVMTEKPGSSSSRVNMGALKQARVFRREIKKNK